MRPSSEQKPDYINEDFLMRAEITFDSSTTTACSRPAPALKLSSAAMQGPSEQGVFVHPQGLIDISQNNNMNFLSQLCSRNTEHVQKEAQVFFGEERVSVFKKKTTESKN